MKKTIDEMSLGRIRVRLEGWNVSLSDEQFDSLTYRQLKAIYKKAEKISALKAEISQIVNSATQPQKK